ncbi:hypothetical protein [Muriicola sp. Z0-33]|uniref:hypothetical protein n=1 Tax=Muriicola sp. Z0-33 TaxID=2816957 RepID=UPI0022386AA2|nr:hypothetical protein [Muriicola sp. Z0-33]MCW5515725.1 hypothetical protein [Muriicola sp. Z0-33]
MKRTLKQFGLFIFFITLTFVSCREEESVFIEGPQEESLEANSNVAILLQHTATKDGSNDNIIDNANCITIELPVTVQVGGVEIIIDSPEDLETIEDIFDEFDDDEDVLDIIFPITVVLPDFTQLVINNLDALDDVTDDCVGENEFDDDIECADIKYPITASVFNSNNEVIDTITLSNDQELYEFIEELDEDDIVNVNFPITVILSDGTEILASNLDELEDVLDNARDDCDEDDDYDFNDDDCDGCTTDQLSEVLVGCTDWRVDKLERNDQDLEDLYTAYRFNFASDGTLTADSNSESFSGTWETNGAGNNIAVVINIPNLNNFNANWNLHEIKQGGSESDVDLRIGDDRLRFRSNCSDTGDGNNGGDGNGGSDLSTILLNGLWAVSNYLDDGVDETNNYNGFTFNFATDGSVIADNGSTTNGTWSVQNGDDSLFLDFGAVIPLDEFNDDWDVISVSDTQVELRDVSGGDGSTDDLIFTKQ